MYKKIPDRENLYARAAILAAEDELSDIEIAQRCGITRRTLIRWKRQPAIQQKINEQLRRIQLHSTRGLELFSKCPRLFWVSSGTIVTYLNLIPQCHEATAWPASWWAVASILDILARGITFLSALRPSAVNRQRPLRERERPCRP
jgi:hypothetical protein